VGREICGVWFRSYLSDFAGFPQDPFSILRSCSVKSACDLSVSCVYLCNVLLPLEQERVRIVITSEETDA